jgi:hypothetical protein
MRWHPSWHYDGVSYPHWIYFPRNVRPPNWAMDLTASLLNVRHIIDSEPLPIEQKSRLTSDVVLGHLRPGLELLGYQVESGKSQEAKIQRPVLFGENGHAEVMYEIDAFHDELGIAVEVEAGRGARGNADYRDIVRTSLLLDAKFLVLIMPFTYRFQNVGKAMTAAAYAKTRDQLQAIYASQRLRLPFDGVLLIGY